MILQLMRLVRVAALTIIVNYCTYSAKLIGDELLAWSVGGRK